MFRASSSVARRSTASQSTVLPSDTSVPRAISHASSCRSLNAHLHCKPQQSAADGNAGGTDRGPAQQLSDLAVVESELDARDDQLAIALAKTLQRGFVAVQRLPPDRNFER